jgi:hypothetical protein
MMMLSSSCVDVCLNFDHHLPLPGVRLRYPVSDDYLILNRISLSVEIPASSPSSPSVPSS